MTEIKKIVPGLLLCLIIAIPAWALGKAFPVVGGPVCGILMGMIIVMIFPETLIKTICLKKAQPTRLEFKLETGVRYTSKKILQYSI
ncbi:MAG: hypothetical protein HGA22_02915, partial [Clostridiales bacterium]|nr:hypothetical protein [Clostridiales bacterium]